MGGAAAKATTVARHAAEVKEEKRLGHEISKGKKEADALEKATAKAAQKLKDDHKAINADYDAKVEQLKEDNKKNVDNLNKLQAKYNKEEVEQEKKDGEAAKTAKQAVSANEAKNKKI